MPSIKLNYGMHYTKVLAAVLPSQKECEDEHGKEKERFQPLVK